ncbi:hypothetical protein CSUI_009152 [Cystoisospora suis]|uniref:Uncharacterized protein n=1 Tax=Cystoisospora suis TaxID=483139 RepID=A0A2C6KKY3_9APIC|nr:hypothetical protein CSUI_009152 [Cystoisospora suis]
MPPTSSDPQQTMGTDEGIDGAEESSGAVYTPDQPDHGSPREYSRNGSPHAQRRISSEENRHMGEETDYPDDSETAPAASGGHSRERIGGERHYSKGEEEDNNVTGRDLYPQTEEHGDESTRGGEGRRDGEICGVAEEQDEGGGLRINQHDDDDPFADEEEVEGDAPSGQADHTDRLQTSSGNDEGEGEGETQDHPVQKKDRAGSSADTKKKRYYYEEPPVIDERKVFVGNTPL